MPLPLRPIPRVAAIILQLCVVMTLTHAARVAGQAGFVEDHANADQATQAAKLPEFEVATIKPIDSHADQHQVGTVVKPGGRVEITTMPLKELICIAFNLSWWQISGGDSWIEKLQYDVQAKPPDSAAATITDLRYGLFSIQDVQLRRMLQALLIERFKLRFHRESKPGKILILERSGKRLAMKAAESSPEGTSAFSSVGWATTWAMTDTSMAQLAEFAGSHVLHRPVVDRTGLTGSFNSRGSEAEDMQTHLNDEVGSFKNFLEEMGLKLTPSTGPVETLVIDHAEPPTPN